VKVNTSFVFTDEQLRTIRAALGRGGAATRKECRYFIDKAVAAAFDKAPEPKPKRRPAPKVVVKMPITLTEEQEMTEWREKRDKIRKMYRTEARVA
jgi:hypothetical protein